MNSNRMEEVFCLPTLLDLLSPREFQRLAFLNSRIRRRIEGGGGASLPDSGSVSGSSSRPSSIAIAARPRQSIQFKHFHKSLNDWLEHIRRQAYWRSRNNNSNNNNNNKDDKVVSLEGSSSTSSSSEKEFGCFQLSVDTRELPPPFYLNPDVGLRNPLKVLNLINECLHQKYYLDSQWFPTYQNILYGAGKNAVNLAFQALLAYNDDTLNGMDDAERSIAVNLANQLTLKAAVFVNNLQAVSFLIGTPPSSPFFKAESAVVVLVKGVTRSSSNEVSPTSFNNPSCLAKSLFISSTKSLNSLIRPVTQKAFQESLNLSLMLPYNNLEILKALRSDQRSTINFQSGSNTQRSLSRYTKLSVANYGSFKTMSTLLLLLSSDFVGNDYQELLQLSVRALNVAGVSAILNHQPMLDVNSALRIVCTKTFFDTTTTKRNLEDVVDLLLRNESINENGEDWREAFIAACRSGYFRIINTLLRRKNGRMEKALLLLGLKEAIKWKKEKVVTLLLHNTSSTLLGEELLINAIKWGSPPGILSTLMAFSLADYLNSRKVHEVLCGAEIDLDVALFLIATGRIDPSQFDYLILRKACKNGRIVLVQALCKNLSWNSNRLKRCLIGHALSSFHFDVARYLYNVRK